jgi:hypothetical protein
MWRTIRMVGSYQKNRSSLSHGHSRISYTIPKQGQCWEEPEEVGVRISNVFK